MAVEELGLEVAVDGFKAFMTKMTKMENAIGKTGKQWTGLGGIAGTATKALGTLAKVGLTAVVAGAAAAAAAVGALAVGMVKLGVDSFKLATDFQSQMAVLGIAASSAGLSFDELHDVALQVGGDITLLGVSATGAADSMTGLYKAGLTTTEIFGDLNGYMAGTAELGGALRASIDLAAASELDMVQASDLAAIALATFGGELETEAERAEFVNDALNNMVQAADASVAEVSDLAAAMTNIGPTAASFGFSMEDVNNALAILSTRGIKGAEAGTALKSMMTNLMRPTDDVQDTLKALNITLFDANGEMKELPIIVEDLSQALYGMNEVTTVAGGRTAEQNALLSEAQKRYAALTRRIDNHNAGLTVMSDSALAKANAELGAANGIIAELGDITGTATTSLREMTEQQRLEAIQTLAGTYGMKAMATLLNEGVEGWDAMAQATANAMGIQDQAAIRADTYAGKMEALEGTIETLKIGIGEAFLPVAQELVTWFSEMVDEHGPALQSIFEAIGTFLQENLPTAIAFATEAFDGIGETVGTFAEILGELISGDIGLLDLIPDTSPLMAWVEMFGKVQEGAGTLVSWFTENWPKIQEVILIVWGVIQEIFGAIGDVLIGEVWPKLQEAFANITAVMGESGIEWGDIFRAVFLAIGTILLGLVAVIVGVVNAVAAAAKNIVQAWRRMYEGFMQVVEGIITMLVAWWEFVKALFTGDFPRALEMAKAFFGGFKDVIVGLLNIIVGWFDLTFGTIIDMVIAWVEGVVEFAKSLKERLVGGSIIPEMLTAIVKAFKEGFARVIQGTKEFLQNMIDQFKEKLLAIVDTVVSFAQDMYEAGRKLVDGIVRGILSAAHKLVEAARSVVEGALRAVKQALRIGSPSQVFAEIGQQAMQGFVAGIVDMTPVVQARIQAAIVPARAGAGGTTNTVNNYHNYNLTTNATTRPGGLRMEFDTMAMATR